MANIFRQDAKTIDINMETCKNSVGKEKYEEFPSFVIPTVND